MVAGAPAVLDAGERCADGALRARDDGADADRGAVGARGGVRQDERELLLRYSWPRAWSRAGRRVRRPRPSSVVGHEPTPAYPYLPNAFVYDNPVNTDSLRWTTRPGVVHARYAPAYATPLLRLEHQSALFRRGDSSLVVLAYDLRSDSALARASDVRAALVLTQGEERDATIVRAA